MTKFHPFSFLLGLGVAATVMGKKQHLRPVIVELSALGLHFTRLGLALIERRRESVEDLWAEVQQLARHKAQGTKISLEGSDADVEEPTPRVRVRHDGHNGHEHHDGHGRRKHSKLVGQS